MIPVAQDRITISRVVETADTDGYDASAPDPTVVASGIRAVISSPSASTALSGGDRVVYSARLVSDPCDLQTADIVTDPNGTEWVCLWATPFGAFGISGMQGELRLTVGAA